MDLVKPFSALSIDAPKKKRRIILDMSSLKKLKEELQQKQAQPLVPEPKKRRRIIFGKPIKTSASINTLSINVEEMGKGKKQPTNVLVMPKPVEYEKVALVQSLEKKMESLTVDDVEIVRVTRFEHDGKMYFREPTKNKVFLCTGPKSVGAYVGRWDPIRQTIHKDIVDSDADNDNL